MKCTRKCATNRTNDNTHTRALCLHFIESFTAMARLPNPKRNCGKKQSRCIAQQGLIYLALQIYAETGRDRYPLYYVYVSVSVYVYIYIYLYIYTHTSRFTEINPILPVDLVLTCTDT